MQNLYLVCNTLKNITFLLSLLLHCLLIYIFIVLAKIRSYLLANQVKQWADSPYESWMQKAEMLRCPVCTFRLLLVSFHLFGLLDLFLLRGGVLDLWPLLGGVLNLWPPLGGVLDLWFLLGGVLDLLGGVLERLLFFFWPRCLSRLSSIDVFLRGALVTLWSLWLSSAYLFSWDGSGPWPFQFIGDVASCFFFSSLSISCSCSLIPFVRTPRPIDVK